MSKYTTVTIFTKKGNLLPYGSTGTKFCNYTTVGREYLAKEREIQLALSTRHERTPKGAKLMCKISCPVNPLPIKGEFEVPSYSVICRWLQSNGWTKRETVRQEFFE